MKWVIRGGILVVVVWLLVLLIPNDPEITNINSSGDAIVAFGDSLVEGVGSSNGSDFPSILSEKIGENILNLGVSGNTTSDALKRIEEVTNQNPKVVIVLIGGNDAIRRVAVDETFSNLEEIVRQIQNNGSAVILVGVQGGLVGDRYKKEFERLSRELGTGLVPDILDGLIGNSKFMSDPIHPNDAGYEEMARRIEPVLNDILSK